MTLPKRFECWHRMTRPTSQGHGWLWMEAFWLADNTHTMTNKRSGKLHSELWFRDTKDPAETAVYLERFANYGITRGELRPSRPIIGIAQTGSDLVPCNRIHLSLVERVKDGIRDAGGVPM